MFLKVVDSSSKKEVFSVIKNKIEIDNKLKLSNLVYLPINKNYVYIFEEDKIDRESKEFINTTKVLKFLQGKVKTKEQNFIIFYETNGKLNILIKEKDNISLDTEIKLEVASFLVFYEKYADSFVFYYLESKVLTEIIGSLMEIYDLHNDIFEKFDFNTLNIENEFISVKVNFIKVLKSFFKIENIYKYKKEIISFIILLSLSIEGIVFYSHYQKEKETAERKAINLSKIKKSLNFSTANENFAKVQIIKKYIQKKDSPFFILKNSSFITYVHKLNLSNKYKTIIKLSNNLFYVEGSFHIKKEIKNIKELRPININYIFQKYNKQGFIQNGVITIIRNFKENELINFLNSLSRENIYTFNIFIKENKLYEDKKINNKTYTIKIKIYKNIKKRNKNAIRKK